MACNCPNDSLLHRAGCTLKLAGIAGDGTPARLMPVAICAACAKPTDPTTPGLPHHPAFCSDACRATFTEEERGLYFDAEKAALFSEV